MRGTLRWAVVAASVVLTGLAALGISAGNATADGLARYGVNADATIVGRNGSEQATVQFLTAAGTVTTTPIAICHHQDYSIGRTVPIRYDERVPSRAWERDMAPQPVPVLPLALIPVAASLAMAIARRRLRPGVTAPVPTAPAPEELPEPAEEATAPEPEELAEPVFEPAFDVV